MIYKSLLILIVILNSSSLFASNLEPCGITSKIEGKSCKDLRVEFDLTSCEPELAKVTAKITCSNNEMSAGYKTTKYSYRQAIESKSNWGTEGLSAKGKIWRAIRTSYYKNKKEQPAAKISAVEVAPVAPIVAQKVAVAQNVEPTRKTASENFNWDSLSMTATLRSIYVSHGIPISDGASLEGSFDYAHDSGASVGIWTANYATSTARSTELDYYVGYGRSFMDKFNLGVLATYFTYLDAQASNNFEFTLSFSYKFFKLLHSYYPQLDGLNTNAIDNKKKITKHTTQGY